LRLAYAGHDGMVVSWNTYSQLSHPSVRYGKDPHHLDKVARTLEPNTVYHYLPLDSNVTGPYSFKTSRHKGDHTPYSMAVVVDLGLIGADGLSTTVGNGAANPLKPGDNNTLQSLMSQGADTDFLWHPGDLAYADYWLKEEIQGYLPNTTLEEGAQVYESLLNQYYDEMTPITAFKPYMLDTETDLGHGYIAPDEPNGTAGEDAGPFSHLKNAQTDWLAKDLAAVDRKKTPWVVVAGHRPWYISIGTSAADICYGWSRLTFHNCSHLTHEFVGSANGTVLDTATLFKDRDCGGHKSH
ncbi:hypothetical protein AOCH_005047, partial [Aspergillus ochraceoroseus]